ncbi:MAG: hypothetical protein ACFFCV_03585, partial [Promethearchaeota archaeon]
NRLDIDFYTHNFFHIFKGTPIYDNYMKFGYEVSHMGEKNKVHIQNNFPFDIYKVPMHPKCARIEINEIADYNSLKILSLFTTRTNEKSFFNNLILISDVIKPSLVKWMQKNLALNGVIVQVYSNKKNFLEFHKKNKQTLYNEYSPTLNYESYYLEHHNNTSLLKPGRIALFNQQIGLNLTLKNTNQVLEDHSKGYDDVHYSIGIDNTPFDTKALYKHLIKLSNRKDIYNYLFNINPLPQFQQLCRWTKNQANCLTLESVIIGNDDSIRICWNSDPIAQLGSSFSDIKLRLEHLKEKSVEKRQCFNCREEEKCVKCIFPYPLSIRQYCEYKKSCETTEASEYINRFNVLKDFLFKPLNPFEW